MKFQTLGCNVLKAKGGLKAFYPNKARWKHKWGMRFMPIIIYNSSNNK